MPYADKDCDLFKILKLHKADFEGKEPITTREAIDWAMENAPILETRYKNAPSVSAALYLAMFRYDVAYFKEITKKRVPNISKIESDEGLRDDGRKQLGIIREIEAEEHRKLEEQSLLLSGREEQQAVEHSVS